MYYKCQAGKINISSYYTFLCMHNPFWLTYNSFIIYGYSFYAFRLGKSCSEQIIMIVAMGLLRHTRCNLQYMAWMCALSTRGLVRLVWQCRNFVYFNSFEYLHLLGWVNKAVYLVAVERLTWTLLLDFRLRFPQQLHPLIQSHWL